eukprot:TRINITY_DN5601_c0_g1_i1.p1 TRINITY_DN5601_c0_g1~~TRINITY_DN5601_c0_g1_i1.p1  ORF type:complete len:419 (+),score=94.45 TRINITY_DN5601_c0_g1_i1:78-1334(+)
MEDPLRNNGHSELSSSASAPNSASKSNRLSSSSSASANPTPTRSALSSSSGGTDKKHSEFICRTKYSNNLPPIPFDPKLLSYPFDKMRFVRYAATSLDRNMKHVLHCEPDLGIAIDLIDPAAYKAPSEVTLEDEDIAIVDPKEQVENGTTKSPSMKRRTESPRSFSAPFLKKSTYITGAADSIRIKPDAIETKPGWRYKDKAREMQRDEQIHAIEQTFEACRLPPKHPLNPNLTAVEVLPVFPDFDLWPNIYSQVVLEKEKVTDPERERQKNDAIIKAYSSENQTKFFAYLVPKKRKRGEDFEEDPVEEDYEWEREYSYEVKKGADYPDSYFFNFVNGHVYYDEISTRVNLSKLKSKEGIPQPSKISTVYRQLSDREIATRDARNSDMLQPESLDPYWSRDRNEDEEEEIKDDDEETK